MRVNSINTFSQNTKNISFKKTAVPYPEYISDYNFQYDSEQQGVLFGIVQKISDFFHPEVTKEAQSIKSEIDSIYDNKQQTLKTNAVNVNPEKQLLSVLA